PAGHSDGLLSKFAARPCFIPDGIDSERRAEFHLGADYHYRIWHQPPLVQHWRAAGDLRSVDHTRFYARIHRKCTGTCGSAHFYLYHQYAGNLDAEHEEQHRQRAWRGLREIGRAHV